MRSPFLSVLILGLCLGGPALAADSALTPLQREALQSRLAWELVESLTTEVGHRMPGTENDALGVAWMEARFKRLGFDRVWTEEVEFPHWVRGVERARMTAPFRQPLVITALGGSPATRGLLETEVVEFADFAALRAVADGSLDGKIAYISNRMSRARDGSGYSEAVVARSRGPYLARQKGAAALLIRSIGTDNDRLPHTGNISNSQHTEPDKGLPVPAAALSNPDADLLSNALRRGQPVRVELEIGSGLLGKATSRNVIGEITGHANPEEVVLVGAHLDSWDLGTGALDDAAGIGITTAAARLVADQGRPARSIWVVAFANEEQGLYGARAFAAAHAGHMDKFILGGEADFGAGRVYAWRANFRQGSEQLIKELSGRLKPLGIDFDPAVKASGSADVGRLRAAGVAVVDMRQDGSRYFDIHHTANDTLDKIDPAALAQNVAAWATLLDFAANGEYRFGPIPPDEENQVGKIILENKRSGKR